MNTTAEAKLYSADPRERLYAGRELAQEPRWSPAAIAQRHPRWPPHWFGSLNAWLVFVGPSPGDSRGTANINWERDRHPTLGRTNEHFATYRDRRGFWPRLRAWTVNAFAAAEVFDVAADAMAITMLGNISAGEVGDAGTIDAAELKRGMRSTREALETIRPRLIVPLHKRVTELMNPMLVEQGWLRVGKGVESVPARNQTFTHYRPTWSDYRRAGASLLVAEAPQHPSRTNFYDPAEMDLYLTTMVSRALSPDAE